MLDAHRLLVEPLAVGVGGDAELVEVRGELLARGLAVARAAELVARLVDRHASLEVVDTREDEVDGPAADRSLAEPAHQVLEVVDCRDVVVVVLHLPVGVDERERLARGGNLGHAALVRRVEEPVHVCELDLVKVKDEQLAGAARCGAQARGALGEMVHGRAGAAQPVPRRHRQPPRLEADHPGVTSCITIFNASIVRRISDRPEKIIRKIPPGGS